MYPISQAISACVPWNQPILSPRTLFALQCQTQRGESQLIGGEHQIRPEFLRASTPLSLQLEPAHEREGILHMPAHSPATAHFAVDREDGRAGSTAQGTHH